MIKNRTRFYIYEILLKIFSDDAFSNITLNNFYKKNNIIDIKDKKFITEVVYGTIKNKLYLEYIIKCFSKSKTKNKIKVILLMSLYQILFMNRTPNYAIVNEAVIISKEIDGKFSSSFVNALLRNIIKNFNANNINFKNDEEKFMIENSCPKDLFYILKKEYGTEKTRKIILSFNNKSKNSIRVNLIKNNVKELKQYFENKKIEAVHSNISPDNLLLKNIISNDEKFNLGNYIFQGESSSLVAHSIGENKKINYKILDTCAAPGGKSLHIATLYPNSIVYSCDKHEHKISLIEDNAKKLDIKNIKVFKQDATIYKDEYKEKFDIIICDVPCSGIGVIKNKPEIKYKINTNYINQIRKTQLSILENSKKYLKENGILVYSTCTIDNKENEDNIKKFLKKNNNFVLEKISIDNSIIKEYKKGMIKILPDEYECDGFFICKLRKKGV